MVRKLSIYRFLNFSMKFQIVSFSTKPIQYILFPQFCFLGMWGFIVHSLLAVQNIYSWVDSALTTFFLNSIKVVKVYIIAIIRRAKYIPTRFQGQVQLRQLPNQSNIKVVEVHKSKVIKAELQLIKHSKLYCIFDLFE